MKLRISKRERVIIVFTAMTVIATIVFITLGRYSGSLGGVAHASIAKPQTSLVRGGNNEINMDKGNVGEYRFYVSNKDGAEISEVSMTYSIDVVTTAGYKGKFKYSLFNCDEIGVYDEANDGVSLNQNGSIVKATDDQMLLPATTETAHHYILKLYPDTAGDFGFNVKVTSVQKD